jgi:hypothetical protein
MGEPKREHDAHRIDTVRPGGPDEDAYEAITVYAAASPELLEAIRKSRQSHQHARTSMPDELPSGIVAKGGVPVAPFDLGYGQDEKPPFSATVAREDDPVLEYCFEPLDDPPDPGGLALPILPPIPAPVSPPAAAPPPLAPRRSQWAVLAAIVYLLFVATAAAVLALAR